MRMDSLKPSEPKNAKEEVPRFIKHNPIVFVFVFTSSWHVDGMGKFFGSIEEENLKLWDTSWMSQSPFANIILIVAVEEPISVTRKGIKVA